MKKVKDRFIVIIGIFLVVLGLFFINTSDNPKELMLALPYVCIGIGCGLFGHGMGNIIANKAIRKTPEIQKQIEINKNDERNIAISNHAKAKAYDVMTYVFGALLVTFALMRVDVIPLLLLVFAYLFVQIYAVYYRFKCEREM